MESQYEVVGDLADFGFWIFSVSLQLTTYVAGRRVNDAADKARSFIHGYVGVHGNASKRRLAIVSQISIC